MVNGLATALDCSAQRVKNDDALCNIPPATAEAAVAWIRSKLNLRAVGDRKATIRRVLLCPGSMTPATMWQRYSEVDMIVAGGVREWENTHHAADNVQRWREVCAGDHRPSRIRGAGNARPCGVAEERDQGSSGEVDRRRRPVLEASLMTARAKSSS
jgi:hypothetical protein